MSSSDDVGRGDLYEVVKDEAVRQESLLNLYAPVMMTLSSESLWPLDNVDGEGLLADRVVSDRRRFVEEYANRGTQKVNPSGPYVEFLEHLAATTLAQSLSTGVKVPLVNVQPLSGSIANLAALSSLAPPGSTVMRLGDGVAHHTHGGKGSLVAKFYKVLPANVVHAETGEWDLESLGRIMTDAKPAVVIIGSSSYTRQIPWTAIRHVQQDASPATRLVADIAHTAGLVLTGLHDNPLPWVDLLTMVGYKSLPGARGGATATLDTQVHELVSKAIFPGVQGSPSPTGIARWVMAGAASQEPWYHDLLARSIIAAKRIAIRLKDHDIPVSYGGTESHLVVLSTPVPGHDLARALEAIGMLCNGWAVKSEEGRLRLGTINLTSRHLGARSTVTPEEVADLVVSACSLAASNNCDLTRLRPMVEDLVRRGAAA